MLNSNQVAKSIVEINRKKYIVSLIKTAVFYAAAAAALVVTAKSSDILHPAVRPVPFFSVLLLLLLIPILRYRLYRVFTRPSFVGVVETAKNSSALEARKDVNIGLPDRPYEMRKVEIYSIGVRTDQGRPHNFSFPSGNVSAYARDYMKKGSHVRYAFGARYPWNEDIAPERPFCPNCGSFGAENETHCSCGCLYLREIRNE